MSTRLIYIEQRRRIDTGKGNEIGLYVTAGRNVWTAESKLNCGKNLLVKMLFIIESDKEILSEKKRQEIRFIDIVAFCKQWGSFNVQVSYSIII